MVICCSELIWDFQFPLLGFLLCIFQPALRLQCNVWMNFQFPLLGFLLCIRILQRMLEALCAKLSIPFIGIFALHPTSRFSAKGSGDMSFQFPLLGFLLCIHHTGNKKDTKKVFYFFQFPLLGFLLCINFSQTEIDLRLETGFQFPLLGFLLCI